MGKTKKANYNKTKVEEVVPVEDSEYTIYSFDKGNRWDIKPVQEAVDPHEARRKKQQKEEDNRTSKKEDFKLGLKCEAWNIQRKSDDVDYLGTTKRWYNNPRIDLPERVAAQKKLQRGTPDIVEQVSEEEEPVVEVAKVKSKKKAEEDSEDFDSQEDSEDDVKFEVVKTVKKPKLKLKAEKRKGGKKNKGIDF
jgi:hypothetical protein